jgi:hypothetical protein
LHTAPGRDAVAASFPSHVFRSACSCLIGSTERSSIGIVYRTCKRTSLVRRARASADCQKRGDEAPVPSDMWAVPENEAAMRMNEGSVRSGVCAGRSNAAQPHVEEARVHEEEAREQRNSSPM